ncbi:hypothetical protein [Lactiplantibacillus pentosus]
MAFVQLLVIIFFIAILATIYFGIRWIISKFTNHNTHYGRKALISISAIAGVLAIVGITDLISNHNEQKLDQKISAQDNSDSSNKKKAQISKINGTDAPDSMDDYTITVNNKKSINVTGKATPNSKIDVTSDYLNDKNTHADKNGNFKITMHLNNGKKNEYLLTAQKSGYEESDIVSVTASPKSNSHKIGGNATTQIQALQKQYPKAVKYVDSINYNGKYGYKVTTKSLKLTKQTDSSKAVAILSLIMQSIHETDTSNGIGFVQNSSDGYGLYAVYYAANSDFAKTKTYGTADFFNKSTSFYVNGSKTHDNLILDNMELNKQGPKIDGKTYVNMLMND